MLAASSASAGAEITPQEARTWKPDIDAARQYADARAGHVGFAVFDLLGRLRHSGGGGRARTASVIKVMLLVAYLRQGDVRHRDLTQYEKSLLRPMIRSSENMAATRIRDLLGPGPILALAERARMKHFRYDSIWGNCRTSARDQALFMRGLRRYVPNHHWRFAKSQLANIVPSQRWGVGKVEPNGWKLHFKGGWGSGTGSVDHQVALLRRDRWRLGIGVLTEDNPSRRYGKETLEGVYRRLLRGLPR